MKKALSILIMFLFGFGIAWSQDGSSCEKAMMIYPSLSCSNTNESAYRGNMQCPTADCSSYINMNGHSLTLDPACSPDNETKQNVLWIKVRATAEQFTINNGKPYIGSGAANANTKDYVVFSGDCSGMTQIACQTLTGGASSTITGLSAGKDYYILASPASTHTTANALSLCITSPVAYEAPGNNCTEALALEMDKIFTLNNAGATADGPETEYSIENNTWYKWKAPADWNKGQSAYVRVFEPACNSSEGLQITLWNTAGNCPSSKDTHFEIAKNPGQDEEYYYQWTPEANRTYFLSVDGYAGTACQFKLELGSNAIAPVNLVSFDAQSDGKSVLLSWLTAEESNNSYFTIEKSRDGKHFLPLKNIEGAGKSTTERFYTSRDEYPWSRLNFYRLRQTDSQGNYTYSRSVAVNVKGEGRIFHAWSNASGDKIDIGYFSAKQENAMLRMIDGKGKQCYAMSVRLSPGSNMYKINASLIPKGEYELRLQTAEGVLRSEVQLEEE